MHKLSIEISSEGPTRITHEGDFVTVMDMLYKEMRKEENEQQAYMLVSCAVALTLTDPFLKKLFFDLYTAGLEGKINKYHGN